jgi:O-antigen/teichoic acid export membrane protein
VAVRGGNCSLGQGLGFIYEQQMSDSSGTELGLPNPAAHRGFARLTRDSVIFALGSAAGKAIGFVLVPFLTRTLTPADFGRFDVLSSLESTIVSALALGLDVATVRLYFEHSEGDRRRLLSTWYVLTAVIVLPPSLAIVLASRQVSSVVFHTGKYQLASAMVGVITVGGSFLYAGLTVLRAQGRPGWYAVISGGNLVVYAIAAVILILAWHRSVGAAMVAMALGQCAGAVAGLILLRRSVFGRPSRGLSSQLLKLALPLAPAVVGLWVADFANRAILLGIRGPTEVAYLGVAIRLASVGVVIVSGFQLAWQPRAFSLGTSAAAYRSIVSDGRKIAITVSAGAVSIGLFGPEAVDIVAGRRYERALPAVGFALIAALGTGVYLVVSTPSAVAKAMGDLGRSSAIAVAVGVAANFALASRFGATGTAAAMALGQFCGILTAVFLARRRDPTLPRWGRVGAIASMASLIVLLASAPVGRSVLARLSLGILFVAALWQEGAIGDALAFGRRFVSSWKSRHS